MIPKLSEKSLDHFWVLSINWFQTQTRARFQSTKPLIVDNPKLASSSFTSINQFHIQWIHEEIESDIEADIVYQYGIDLDKKQNPKRLNPGQWRLLNTSHLCHQRNKVGVENGNYYWTITILGFRVGRKWRLHASLHDPTRPRWTLWWRQVSIWWFRM